MSSSTSSSEAPPAAPAEAARWRRFLLRLLGFAVTPLVVTYLFVALVDPWGMLPVHLPFQRHTVSTNQRFAYPMLARDPRFDSVVIGTSTSRLLQPAWLDALFGGHFANLAMNASTAWEQSQLLALFTRTHPAARRVLIGLDMAWCETGPLRRLTPRPFPEWMYEGSPWRGYREILNAYAVEEAGKQALAMMGLRRPRYGTDGYTNFLPPDSAYDLDRVRHALQPPPAQPAPDGTPVFDFPQHALLAERLAALPPETQVLAFFAPYHHSLHPPAGTLDAMRWEACKTALAEVVRTRPGTVLADFMIPSSITSEDTNYWDQQHYRVAIARRLADALARAAGGEASEDGIYRLLVPGG